VRNEGHAEYGRSIAPYCRTDGGYDIVGEFLVATARRPG